MNVVPFQPKLFYYFRRTVLPHVCDVDDDVNFKSLENEQVWAALSAIIV